MSPEEFEEQLKRQEPRAIPADWKSEILQAAEQSKETKVTEFPSPVSGLLSQLILPYPRMWGALAASWIAIICLQLGSAEFPSESMVQNQPKAANAALLAQQKQFKLELLEIQPLTQLSTATPRPQPRSSLSPTARNA